MLLYICSSHGENSIHVNPHTEEVRLVSDRIKLQSTLQGFGSTIFWSIVWAVVLLLVASALSSHIDAADLQKAWWDQSHDESAFFAGIVMSVLRWAVGFIAVCTLYCVFYGVREENVFSRNQEGNWSRVTCTTYGFPFSRDVRELVFDRIIDIAVNQSSIDRLLNTGTVQITMVTFTNADSKQRNWLFPAIKDPFPGNSDNIACFYFLNLCFLKP